VTGFTWTSWMRISLRTCPGARSAQAIADAHGVTFDAHLMVDDPDLFVRQAKEFARNWVSVHVESCRHLDRTLALSGVLGCALAPL